ncbi:IBR domain-containing protein [Sansalvadorimonas sp. 2012CJ34-2]|uniref:IBR domain-containing protein n=1 Tax=Parendozoicomonas callyspongiae TaxID=2942213 RepID=A0ABT0PKJ3_9GAMM|nr:IBR domain-containing protein [Sansalvadorimonas sp. 2012CJ34-2]MCL6271496.1 IBR domain-containing protein [Sansalvadorimonas sp. 2012CJ34-2]
MEQEKIRLESMPRLRVDLSILCQVVLPSHDLRGYEPSLPYSASKSQEENSRLCGLESRLSNLSVNGDEVEEIGSKGYASDEGIDCKIQPKTIEALFCTCGARIAANFFDEITLIFKGETEAECLQCNLKFKALQTERGILVNRRSQLIGFKTVGYLGIQYDLSGRDCLICMSPMNQDDGELNDGLSCGEHHACRSCLFDQLENSVLNHKRPECPGFACSVTWSDDDILLVCGDKRILEKISFYELEEACSKDPSMFFCPAQNCSYIGFKPDVNVGEKAEFACPRRNCEQKMLFYRGRKKDHAQLILGDQAQQYENYCQIKRMVESGDWKLCPRCKTPIEKLDGCHHITCGKCKHEFCWVCMELWRKEYDGRMYTHGRCIEHNARSNSRPIRQVALPAFGFEEVLHTESPVKPKPQKGKKHKSKKSKRGHRRHW